MRGKILAADAQRRSQRGAVAIEFALLFVIFFTLFYAIASYSVPLALMQAFQYAAAEGARAAVAVEPEKFSDLTSYQDAVVDRVRAVVTERLEWLPEVARQEVLGINGAKVGVAFDNDVVTVTVSFPDYGNQPLIPMLNFPGVGAVPKLPQNLTSTASLQL
ncbi:MAG: TadE/TadG family type IV pilus assembly protein [Methylohalobius sp. ZOD2]